MAVGSRPKNTQRKGRPLAKDDAMAERGGMVSIMTVDTCDDIPMT